MKKRKALSNVPDEYHECLWYFEWVSYNPLLKEYIIHHVNEGKRSRILGHMLKLIGMRSGIPDYQYPIANENWNGLWIELKTRDKEKHLKDKSAHKKRQDAWIAKLLKVRQYATYAYGYEHAIIITKKYLANEI